MMPDKDSFPARTSATNFAVSPTPVFACATAWLQKTQDAEVKTSAPCKHLKNPRKKIATAFCRILAELRTAIAHNEEQTSKL